MTDTNHPSARIGHVHLKVSDIERGLGFWRDVIRLEVQARYGENQVFLWAGGYHHHIAHNNWMSKGAGPAPKRAAGLFHVALVYPDRAALAQAVRRVVVSGVAIEGASDHGVSEAVYLCDHDGNGVEIYWDRPPEECPRHADGSLAITTERLELPAPLAS